MIDSTHQRTWHILGAGAIGGLWACRLAKAGHHVTLITQHPSSTQRKLLWQRHANDAGESFLFDECEPHQCGVIERLLITTKAPDTAPAMQAIRHALSTTHYGVLLQNGMGIEEQLHKLRINLCLLPAITKEGVWRPDRNTLQQAGAGETLIGARHANEHNLLHDCAHDLASSHHALQIVNNITEERWKKLAINSVINPLTALFRCRNGEILKNAECMHLIHGLCVEASLVMRTEGFDMTADELEQRVIQVAQDTGMNQSSMLSDIRANRRTEIEFINGYIVQRADTHQLHTPIHRQMLQSVLALHP